MKNTLFTIITILSLLSCKAQAPIVPLYFGEGYATTENVYYKDTNNDFDKFIGTWKHTNGNEELTLSLKKKTLVSRTHNNVTYYTDYIYGEYKYIDTGGNILVNTLPNIDGDFTNLSDYKIFGNRILNKYYHPACDDCDGSERRVKLVIIDPLRDYIKLRIVLRTVPNVANPDINDITLNLTSEGWPTLPEGQPIEARIPANDFRLIKQ